MSEFHERAFYIMAWEIFSRLSAKSIYKLKTTSKYCFDFINDESFCKQQDRLLRSTNDCCLFLQSDSYDYADKKKIEPILLDQNSCTGVHPKSIKFLRGPFTILASCGGLLLCRTRKSRARRGDPFIIINPATGMLVKVPVPLGISEDRVSSQLVHFILNYDQHDDLILMIITEDDSGDWNPKYKCMVYSFEHKEWRANGSNQLFDLGNRYLPHKDHVVLDSCVYILSDTLCYYTKESQYYFPYIVIYNMKEEKTQFLKLPRRAHRGRQHRTCKMKIFAWDNWKTICLVRLRKGLFTVWVLEDIKNNDSWVQILRKSLWDMGVCEDWKLDITDFKVINGNTLVIATKHKKVYSYNLVDDDLNEAREKTATIIWDGYRNPYNILKVFSYSNTLRQIPNSMPIP